MSVLFVFNKAEYRRVLNERATSLSASNCLRRQAVEPAGPRRAAKRAGQIREEGGFDLAYSRGLPTIDA
jgi:hypothetical protein